MGSTLVDRLSRSLASTRTRRTLGGTAFAAVAGLLGLLVPEEAAAHNPTAACRDIAWAPERRACLRWAKRHHNKHRRAKPKRPKPKSCRPCHGQGDPANRISCVKGKCRLTRKFTIPGGPYHFTIPRKGELTVVALGGGGGDGGPGGAGSLAGGAGGKGAGGSRARSAFPVRAGVTLDVFVGGAGQPGGPGGGIDGVGGRGGVFGGNGQDGTGVTGPHGGGGGGSGGASRVVVSGGRHIVAGGGGGGGGGGGRDSGDAGGDGGAGGTGANAADGPGGPGGVGGFGGTPPESGEPGLSGTPSPGVNPGDGRVTLVFKEA